MLLALRAHLFRRLDAIKVIDGYISSLLCKRVSYDLAEPTACLLALMKYVEI